MRKIFLTGIVFAAVSVCGFFAISPAVALTPAPAGLAAAIDDANPVHSVAYVCRRVHRCGPYGCGWRRVCFETGPRYYGYRGGYRSYNGCPFGYTVQDGVCKPYRGY
jgi:hypothetical protein